MRRNPDELCQLFDLTRPRPQRRMAGGLRALVAAAALGAAWALTPGVVGTVSCGPRKVTVIGTVHTPSQRQREEVAALIEEVAPDIVLVELDAERLEVLWDRSRDAPPAYGAELAEAVRAAIAADAPVVLGDAVKPVRAVFEAAPFLDARRLARGARLLVGASPPPEGVALQRLDVFKSLATDPAKAAPLLTAVAMTVVGAAAANAAAPGAAGGGAAALVDGAACLAVVAAARVADVLLLARDDVLSENALRALEIGAALKAGGFRRLTFDFSKRPGDLVPLLDVDGLGGEAPFLTLRSPLREGERRRVNLFEPRWLAMMDALAIREGSEICTVHAVNRCYLASGDGATVAADVVVDPTEARVAVVERVEEGARPVSGDRRLAIWLRGGPALEARDLREAPGRRGFLLGRPEPRPSPAPPRDLSAPVHAVAVVGLVHANPLLARCADRNLRSASERGELDGEVMRAILERERAARLADLPWSDYDRASRKS